MTVSILEVEVLNVRRGKNSRCGNPKWHFILRETHTGYVFWAETETNVACGYLVTHEFINYKLRIYGKQIADKPFKIKYLDFIGEIE